MTKGSFRVGTTSILCKKSSSSISTRGLTKNCGVVTVVKNRAASKTDAAESDEKVEKCKPLERKLNRRVLTSSSLSDYVVKKDLVAPQTLLNEPNGFLTTLFGFLIHLFPVTDFFSRSCLGSSLSIFLL